MSQRLIIWAIVWLVAGCERLVDSRIDIAVSEDSGGHVFQFESCAWSFRPQRVDVPLIVLLKETEAGRVSHCELRKSSPSVRSLASSWRYGTVPHGYVAQGCEPLQPNETYQIQVSAAGGGRREFSVAPDGHLILGKGSCR